MRCVDERVAMSGKVHRAQYRFILRALGPALEMPAAANVLGCHHTTHYCAEGYASAAMNGRR